MEDKLTNLNKHIKRITILDKVTGVLAVIALIGTIIITWTSLNNMMYKRAYDDGYERGYEQASWDYIDREINSSDYGTIRLETDADIWERYHDCSMYGLPEYARPYCENETKLQ